MTNRLYYFGAALGSRLEQGRTLAYTRGNYTYSDPRARSTSSRARGRRRHRTPSGPVTSAWTRRGPTPARAPSWTPPASTTTSRRSRWPGVSYNSALGPRLLVEAHYSRRWLTYRGSGSRDVTLEGGTPIWDRSRSDARFNSPQGCAVCPGSEDERDNQDIGARAWLSLPSTRTGPHEITAGIDAFQETRRTNAYQSGSSYRVRATRSVVAGDVIYPVFPADRTTWIYWQPVLEDAIGNDLRTYSVFASDTWRPSGRLTIKAGLTVRPERRSRQRRGACSARRSLEPKAWRRVGPHRRWRLGSERRMVALRDVDQLKRRRRRVGEWPPGDVRVRLPRPGNQHERHRDEAAARRPAPTLRLVPDARDGPRPEERPGDSRRERPDGPGARTAGRARDRAGLLVPPWRRADPPGWTAFTADTSTSTRHDGTPPPAR